VVAVPPGPAGGERPAGVRAAAWVRAALRGRPPFVPGELEAMRRQVAALGREGRPDVAFGGLYVAPGLASAGAKALVIDEHNFEAELYRRLSRSASGPGRRLAGLVLWQEVLRFERRWLPEADAVTVCSARDAGAIRPLAAPGARIEVVPNGADLEFAAAMARAPEPETLVLVGSMTWAPNVDGARFLVDRVLPLVWRERPGVKVLLVGKEPTTEVRSLAGERVEVVGEVPDVRPYLARAALTVIPLRSGGGTRLKLLEAMAAGVPIVSTEIGAEGLDLRHDTEAWLANDADGLAAGILALLSDPERAERMAAVARRRVEADFSWERAGERLNALIAALS
jgi:polysaccharide biosynthesis protein PslH